MVKTEERQTLRHTQCYPTRFLGLTRVYHNLIAFLALVQLYHQLLRFTGTALLCASYKEISSLAHHTLFSKVFHSFYVYQLHYPSIPIATVF